MKCLGLGFMYLLIDEFYSIILDRLDNLIGSTYICKMMKLAKNYDEQL